MNSQTNERNSSSDRSTPSSDSPESSSNRTFEWHRQQNAGALIFRLLEEFVSRMPLLQSLQTRLLEKTGTRLSDWIDHFDIDFPAHKNLKTDLIAAGFKPVATTDKEIYTHPGALFPAVAQSDDGINRLGLKVDSIPEFLVAHQIQTVIGGEPFSARRIANITGSGNLELWIIEKHGVPCWQNPELNPAHIRLLPIIYETFLVRDRSNPDQQEGFRIAGQLIDDSISRIGKDRTCDLFFHAERHYWQLRNSAARIQKSRQDVLGMGWANHDHHTYRSSRRHFADLIAVLEKLGFECRERFYAGAEAGWGAQVLEQANCGLVVFADVDLSEEELAGDFAHQGLEPRSELGTVGLWCGLHGEAFLNAGLHHLECQFDFDAARQQLSKAGVSTMDPFTDFEFLRQCFTTPEIWPVEEFRIAGLLDQSMITESEAEEFRKNGAVGSHLEILERNDGYKGFNQTGVSKIISKTDPRKLVQGD